MGTGLVVGAGTRRGAQVEEVLTHDGNKRGQDSKMQVRSFSLRELPDMMSASEGGGGLWKSGRSKGGCVNFRV